jgi:glycosyltransferase involved in cell wall biosynthesis
MGISLVLLTYNEIDGITYLYDKIPFGIIDECFAVDGGSTDGTREFLKEKNIRIVDQEEKGRGEAFRVAFKTASQDNLIFYSPDGNEDPMDIGKFKYFFDNGYDLVVASRMSKGAKNEEDDKILRFRKWANISFNIIANTIWNRGKTPYVTDCINGFWGITKSAWEKISPDGDGYTIEYQTTIRAMKLGLKVGEFPTIESSRIGGESYARSIPTGLRFLGLLFKEIRIGKKFLRI